MRRTTATPIAAVAVVVALAAAVAWPGSPSAGAATVEVEVRDDAFVAPDVTVQVGDTVTWVQTGVMPHSVTADDGSFDSSPDCLPMCMQQGDTFSHTFTQPGTYRYHCVLHGAPGGIGMSGVVTVVAAAPGTTSAGPEPGAAAEPAPTTTSPRAPTATGTATAAGGSEPLYAG